MMSQFCLLCDEVIVPTVSWRRLFSAEKEELLCSTCEGGLERIGGECCRMCSRPFSQLDEQFRHGDLCNDCVRWEADPEWKGYLDQNVSLFQYNDFLKEVIARFKFRGDYIIAKAFTEPLKQELSKLAFDFLVPIPLSEERLYERGFNQAEALLTLAGYTPTPLLTRVHSEKQSKKSRTERIHVPQVFQVSESMSGTILLVDDIYTTGSTLRHAAKILKEAGAERIQSITLAR
jgi:competence protein ComFC